MLKVTLIHTYYSGFGVLTLVADAWVALQVVASADNSPLDGRGYIISVLRFMFWGNNPACSKITLIRSAGIFLPLYNSFMRSG